eukprot:NODE_94_length_21525_cov_0.751003.p7 type:complete len:321 gc:universal NODE_94_length_21525_cov_0.751003:19053-18091(-)
MATNICCFQLPPHNNNRCNLLVCKSKLTQQLKEFSIINKYSSVISENSDLIYTDAIEIPEKVYSLLYSSDFVFLGLKKRVLIYDATQLNFVAEINVHTDEKSRPPHVITMLFESSILCIGCSDASIHFFGFESKGFEFKSFIILPSSIVKRTFKYSEGYLYFATIAGYIGKVSLLGFQLELVPLDSDILALDIYGDQVYLSNKQGRILIIKKNSQYSLVESINTNLENEAITSLVVTFPTIHCLSDKGIYYSFDTSIPSSGSFLVTKGSKEYTVDATRMQVSSQEMKNLDCVGDLQVENFCGIVCVDELGEIFSSLIQYE